MMQITLLCLFYLSVDVAGSGNPLQAADFCNWRSYGYNRSNGPILFAESVILIHFVHETAKNRAKKRLKPSKKDVFSLLLDRVLDPIQQYSTGVATTNSTNKYQKYESIELGDQLYYWRHLQITNSNVIESHRYRGHCVSHPCGVGQGVLKSYYLSPL